MAAWSRWWRQRKETERDMSNQGDGTARKRGLGMGLSALLGTPDDDLAQALDGAEMPARAEAGAIPTLPVAQLEPSPFQPREHFDKDELEALAESIRAHGIMQPLVVRPAPGEARLYQIIAGERRWRAAQIAGLHEVPVVIRALSDTDALQIALIENLQRQDLSPFEEATAYRRLIDEFGCTQEALAGVLGKSRAHIANCMRLLNLPSTVRRHVEEGRLSAGHARALLGADDPGSLASIAIGNDMSVRETEELVREAARIAAGEDAAIKQPKPRDANIVALEEELGSHLGLRVDIKPKGRGQSGIISLRYSTLDQLDDVLTRLRAFGPR